MSLQMFPNPLGLNTTKKNYGKLLPKSMFTPNSLYNSYASKLCERLRFFYAAHQWFQVLEVLMMLRAYHMERLSNENVWSVLNSAVQKLPCKTDLRQVFFEKIPLFRNRFYAQTNYLLYKFETTRTICPPPFELLRKHLSYRITATGLYGSALYESVELLCRYTQFYETSGDDPDSLEEGWKLFKACCKNITKVQQMSKDVASRHYLTSGYKSIHGSVFWILGPTLHLYEYLKANNVEYLPKTYADIISNYIQNCPDDDLPSLRIIVRYLLIYQREKEGHKIVYLLHKICRLCPSDPMVLDYVKSITSYDLMPTDDMLKTDDLMPEVLDDSYVVLKTSTDSPSSCPLAGPEALSVIMRIRLLTRLLEYDQWKDQQDPWDRLYTSLCTVLRAWTQCWECTSCVLVRDKFIEIVPTLELWDIILRGPVPEIITLESSYIYAYRAFAGYILMHNTRHAKRVMKRLTKLNMEQPLRILEAAFNLEGPHSDECEEFLKDLKSLVKANRRHEEDEELEIEVDY